MNSENYYGDEPDNSEQTISKKIQNLEIDLDHLRKYQEEIKINKIKINNQKWNVLIILVTILFLVSIPSILVILDRWVNLPEVRNYPRDYLCRINFLCIDGLPGYFFWIVIFLLISAMVVFTYGDVFSPSLSSIFRNFKEEENAHHYRLNKTLIISFLFLFLEIAVNIKIKRIPGAELLVIILFFYIYFINHEEYSVYQKFLSLLTSIKTYLKLNSLLVVTIIISFVYLFLTIKNYYESFGNLNWIFLIFLLPVLFLIKSQIKKLHPLFWPFSFTIIFYSYHMDNWLYTKIGDEYAFFYFARDLNNRPQFWQFSNFFSIDGVYAKQPVFSSIISNLLMRFLGFDHLGWIFSNYFILIISIIFFYLFFKEILNNYLALMIIIFMSFSLYLIGFSKIGYNNLQALLFGAVIFWMSGKFLKKRTLSNGFLVGVISGFLLYTYQAALFYLPIVVILLLIFHPPKSRMNLKFYYVSFLGFIILCLPLLFQPDFIKILYGGTFFNQNNIIQNSHNIIQHLKTNFIFSSFSYLYLFKESHYVVFSMIDPISAIFFSIGLLVAIKNIFREKLFLFFVVSYGFILLSVGMIHDYPAPSITRLFIVLPWMFFFVSLGVIVVKKSFFCTFDVSKKASNFFSVIVIIIIIAVNFLQSTVILQKKYAYYYFEPVVFKVMQYNTKNLYNRSEIPENYLFLTPDNYDLNWMNIIQDVYNIPESKVQLHRIIYETQGISEDWEKRIESDNDLFVFAPTSFSEEILNQISEIMSEKGRNLCQLRYRKDSPVMAYLWINPKNQLVCDELFNFSK